MHRLKFNDLENAVKLFVDIGVDKQLASSLVESGYRLLSSYNSNYNLSRARIIDTFYGESYDLSSFLSHTYGNSESTYLEIPEYSVKSLGEIRDILQSSGYHRLVDRICFRGQNREYFTKRPIPNPHYSKLGDELIIIPSAYRKFNNNWNERFGNTNRDSIFTTILCEDFYYYGIEKWQELPERNYRKYGSHTLSDLQDFPEPENQEYFKRWWTFRAEGPYSRDLPLVEQHYGIDTNGLDITFDVSVAAFFATHEYRIRSDGTSFYDEANIVSGENVIYCFLFLDDNIKRSTWEVKVVDAFNHARPNRPIRQSCALPFFHESDFNAAVSSLKIKFRIEKGFDRRDLPTAAYLFPDEAEDPFLATINDLKRQREINGADLFPYDHITVYRFD